MERCCILRPLAFLVICAALLGRPALALAHGGESSHSTVAGSLSWVFVAFGAAVIAIVFLLLFVRNSDQERQVPAESLGQLSGVTGYLAKMRRFSRNARLYIVHVVGMDVIYGSWMVVFNLYLLAVGFDVAFIGLRILLTALARSLCSIPAGLISDRIGRKLSFILGDGGGAVISLVAISTADPALLLATGVLSGAFGALHGVAEPAFMAENSRDYERVHLFSVANGSRVAASIIGSALAGLVSLLFSGGEQSASVGLYRLVAYIGIAGWFASLIPALLMEQVARPASRAGGLRGYFSGMRHPQRIWRLIAPEAMVAMGAGFALPLLNVYFKEHLGANELQIGATFAAGEALLVTGALLAPLLAMRLGKVRAVVITRFASLPFILLLAYAQELGALLGSVFMVAGLAHVARISLSNMASPVRSAFAMEILDPGERGTQVGIEMALSSALAGLAGYLGAQLIHAGDLRTPFLLMAGCLFLGNLLFWQLFARWEGRQVTATAATPAAAAVVAE